MFSNEEVAALFQSHRDELGFVNVAQVREKDTYVVGRDGELAGAAICNHCVRKPQTTLYDIAVYPRHRRDGVATELVEQIAVDSPHGKIVAKCPFNLPANEFYEAMGWVKMKVESGKNRDLIVWKYEI
jgi:GNAT superfamily N-acetyltransferase